MVLVEYQYYGMRSRLLGCLATRRQDGHRYGSVPDRGVGRHQFASSSLSRLAWLVSASCEASRRGIDQVTAAPAFLLSLHVDVLRNNEIGHQAQVDFIYHV